MIKLNIATNETRFACQRCTKCCSLDVMLSKREMLDLGPNVDAAWRTTKKLRKGTRFICCLLEGKDCKIYLGRPLLCRLYPFFAVPLEQLALLGEALPDDSVAIKGGGGVLFYFIYDDNCPGIGKGDPIKGDDILDLTMRHLSEMEDGA